MKLHKPHQHIQPIAVDIGSLTPLAGVEKLLTKLYRDLPPNQILSEEKMQELTVAPFLGTLTPGSMIRMDQTAAFEFFSHGAHL